MFTPVNVHLVKNTASRICRKGSNAPTFILRVELRIKVATLWALRIKVGAKDKSGKSKDKTGIDPSSRRPGAEEGFASACVRCSGFLCGHCARVCVCVCVRVSISRRVYSAVSNESKVALLAH